METQRNHLNETKRKRVWFWLGTNTIGASQTLQIKSLRTKRSLVHGSRSHTGHDKKMRRSEGWVEKPENPGIEKGKRNPIQGMTVCWEVVG